MNVPAPPDSPALRQEIIATALRLQAQRVLPGALGNFSVRIAGERVLITPSSRAYHTMLPEDLAVVSLDGAFVEGPYKPSIETGMHAAIYNARPDVGGIVHAHSTHACALAAMNRPLPVVLDEMSYYMKGGVPLAPYVRSGTPELARIAVETLGSDNAVLLGSHGLIAVGATLLKAEQTAEVVEHSAEVYLLMLQTQR